MADNMSFQTCNEEGCNRIAERLSTSGRRICMMHAQSHIYTGGSPLTQIVIDLLDDEPNHLSSAASQVFLLLINQELSSLNARKASLLAKLQEIDRRISDRIEELNAASLAINEYARYRKIPISYNDDLSGRLTQLKSTGTFNYEQIYNSINNLMQRSSEEDARRISDPIILPIEHTQDVHAVAISPCSRYIASASRDRTIKIWDTGNRNNLIATLSGHGNDVSTIDFHPQGHILVSGSHDSSIKIWRYLQGNCDNTLEVRHNGKIYSVKYSPSGDKIASAGEDTNIMLWREDNGQMLGMLRGHTNAIKGIAFSEDGQFIVSGSTDRTIRVWNLNSMNAQRTIDAHNNSIYAIALKGRLVLSGGSDKEIKCWDWTDGTLKSCVSENSDIRALCFSDSGSYYASGCGEINIWKETNNLQKKIQMSIANSVVIKRNMMVTGHKNKTVVLWRLGYNFN